MDNTKTKKDYNDSELYANQLNYNAYVEKKRMCTEYYILLHQLFH